MHLSGPEIIAWYTKRLHDFYFQRYVAYRGYTETGEPLNSGSDDGYPSDHELSESALRLEPSTLPATVREAHAFYARHFNEEDIGTARVYLVPAEVVNTYAVRTTTDGDDGYLEIFDAPGNFIAGGRTHLDQVAWGTREWLREQVANHGEYPPELKEAAARSLWGKPLPWDCQAVCWQCDAKGHKGSCQRKAGHRTEVGDMHCCSTAGHTWDESPPDPRFFAKPEFELKLFDQGAVTGTLPENKLAFTTSLGSLSVFACDIKKIEFAITNPDETNTDIGRAIHRLGSEQKEERTQAESDLFGFGARAYTALAAAAQIATGDLQRRARALTAKIKASAAAELLSTRKRDLVTTRDANFAGKLDANAFDFTTSEGTLTFQMSDLVALTQLPGPVVEVPRPDPRWLGRFFTNWYGVKLTFAIVGTAEGSVYGTNLYSMDSTLAAAAVHAGVVQAGEAKTVRVEIVLAPPNFVGSTQNGITSDDWAEVEAGAFRFVE